MPRRRTIVRFLLVGLALLAGYVIFESYRLWQADPVIAVDHRAAMHTRAIVMSGVDPDAALDGWDALVRAFDVHEAVTAEAVSKAQGEDLPSRGEWDVGLFDYNVLLGGEKIPDFADREIDALLLFEERGGADELATFARASTAIAPPRVIPAGTDLMGLAQAGIGLMLDDFARARDLARALAGRMRVAQADGDPAAIAASFDALLAIARSMSYQPGLLGHLVGQAIAALAVGELNHEIVEHEMSEALCRRLLDVLDRRKLAPVELAIEAERELFHEMMQYVFTDDGDGDGRLAEDNIGRAALARFLGPRRAKVVAVADEYYDGFVGKARLSATERAAGFDRAAFISALGFSPSNRFVRDLLPELDRAIVQIDRSQSQIDSARLMLAIEIYRVREAAPPDRLEDLAPSILRAIPVDPLHGGPFGYRRVETDENQDGFLLYSYGRDGKDDGGQTPAGTVSAYSEDGAGFDAVINTPRDPWP